MAAVGGQDVPVGNILKRRHLDLLGLEWRRSWQPWRGAVHWIKGQICPLKSNADPLPLPLPKLLKCSMSVSEASRRRGKYKTTAHPNWSPRSRPASGGERKSLTNNGWLLSLWLAAHRQHHPRFRDRTRPAGGYGGAYRNRRRARARPAAIGLSRQVRYQALHSRRGAGRLYIHACR